MTSGRIYGAIGCVALIAYFIVPPAIALSNETCRPPLACPVSIQQGVREVFAFAALYCVIAGILIGRILDNEPVYRGRDKLLIFLIALALFAAPLWLMLHAAFY